MSTCLKKKMNYNIHKQLKICKWHSIFTVLLKDVETSVMLWQAQIDKDKSFFAVIGTDLLASGIMPQSHYKNKSKVSNLKLASTGCTKSVLCSSKKSDSLMALQHWSDLNPADLWKQAHTNHNSLTIRGL